VERRRKRPKARDFITLKVGSFCLLGWMDGYMEGLWKGNTLPWGFSSLANEGS